MLTVGDRFPDFRLRANVSTVEGKQFVDVTRPTDKWLVFYAYPKDFTFICPTEIIEFDKKAKDFADRDAVVIGGSTDNEFSKLAWRTQHADLKKTTTPLAFITPALAMELGILHKQEGAALRVTYVVDPDGIIRSVSATDLSVGRNVDEVVRVLDALQSDELCPCNWRPGQQTLGAA
jgi:alkyl hydroperoxide reductase subunit AhpC